MLTELDRDWTQGEYLNFRDEGKCDAYHAKTRVFTVISRQTSISIGVIKWFSTWRRYVYFPLTGIVTDAGCLRDIADFCELKTKAQKVNWKTQN